MHKHKITNTIEKNIEQEISDESDSISKGSERPKKKTKFDETISKKSNVSSQLICASIPTNMKMPESLFFEKREGTKKFASWNVNGLNSALKKGFRTYVEAEDAEILCLQGIKVNKEVEGVVDYNKYKYRWWNFEDKKTGHSSGVAVFSKVEPISTSYGLSAHPNPELTKGRIITLEFETLYYVACHVPCAGQKLARLQEKITWDKAMEKHLRQLDEKKPVIWAGDLNVAHKPIDLARPDNNQKTAGFTPEERESFERILNGEENKFVDTWRYFHPNAKDHYTYHSYRFQCRPRNIGWRLDYHVISKRILDRVVESDIRLNVYGASNHVPIIMVIKGDL